MKTKQSLYMNGIPLLLALLLIAALSLWAPPCSGQLELANGNFTFIKCVYTAKAAMLIAVILIFAALENIAKKRLAALTYVVFGATLIAITFTSALGIGICANVEMACHTSALWIRIFGALIIVDGVVSFFLKDQRSL